MLQQVRSTISPNAPVSAMSLEEAERFFGGVRRLEVASGDSAEAVTEILFASLRPRVGIAVPAGQLEAVDRSAQVLGLSIDLQAPVGSVEHR